MLVPEAPIASVVIATYNCAAYIRQAVASALDQTLARELYEVIVLDDGSTDDTASVLAEFGNAISYVRLDHGGVSKARNHGIRMARGRYVAFLDADDYWLPQRLERALDVLKSDERIFVNTDYYLETKGDLATEPFFRSRSLECLFELEARSQFDFALEQNFIHCMTVAPKKALHAAGGFNERLCYGEDWDLWLRLLECGYAVRLVREPCAVYRYMRPGAASSRYNYRMARDKLFVLSQYPGAVSPYRWRRTTLSAGWVGLQKAIQQLGLRSSS